MIEVAIFATKREQQACTAAARARRHAAELAFERQHRSPAVITGNSMLSAAQVPTLAVPKKINIRPSRKGMREVAHIDAPPPPRVKIEDVQNAVCRRYGINKATLNGERRGYPFACRRMVGMFLSRRLTGQSLFQIGHHFGGRHHTTVFNAVSKIGALVAAGGDIADDVAALTAELTQGC